MLEDLGTLLWNFTVCVTLHALMWFAINTNLSNSYCLFTCIMHIRSTL